MDFTLLGKRIREERQKLNLTQEKLAEKIEVSEAYMGQIERGERNLSLNTLVRLTNQLGVTVDFLLRDSVKAAEDHFTNHMRQMMIHRSDQEKFMAMDVLKVMISHLDSIKESQS